MKRMSITPSVSAIGLVPLVLLLLVSAALSGSNLTHGPAASPANPPSQALAVSVGVAPAYPTPIHHVVVVYLENEPASTVLAQGPFEARLASTYAYASHFYALCHPSAPNYLASTSGAGWQCEQDNRSVYSTTNVGDLVEAAHMTWGAFAENMPQPCYTANSGLYVVRHVPFLYYGDIVDNASRCDSTVTSFGAWDSDMASGTIPNYAFVTPNDDDNGHDTGVAGADTWLQGWLPPLLNASWFASSAIFLVYDESAGSDTSGYNGTDGGNVYMALVSPYARMGYASTTDYSDYNLLTTTEWLLGLGNTGHADADWTKWPPMKDLFRFPTEAPVTYTVGGFVNATNGAPLPAAEVRFSPASGANVTVYTGSNGAYQVQLENGTYTVSASGSGFASGATDVTVAGVDISTLDFGLVPTATPRYSVSGRVTSTAGTPLASVQLAFVSSTVGGVASSTAANGSFAAQLENGTYQVTASAPGYNTSYVNLTVNGSAVRAFDITLVVPYAPPPLFTLSGVVFASPVGTPVAGATVYLNSPTSAQKQLTGSTGAFWFATVNGTYTISAAAAGFHLGDIYTGVAGVNQSGIVLPLFAASSPLYTVSGYVLTANGTEPAFGATVTVVLSGMNVSLPAFPDGSYWLSLPNGSYEVVIAAQGFSPATTTVSIDGHSVPNENFELPWRGLDPAASSGLPHLPLAALLGTTAVGISAVGLSLLAWHRRSRTGPPNPNHRRRA